MTGLRSRHPADEPDHRRSGGRTGRSLAGLLSPGYTNTCLCYLLVAIVLPLPLALIFAIRFASCQEDRLQAHYLYLRTTIALLVIGAGTGALLILLGAPLSSLVMLAGLVLMAATLLLTVLRCCYGCYCAVRQQGLRNPHSFFV